MMTTDELVFVFAIIAALVVAAAIVVFSPAWP